jgi:hypothetical protein
MNIQLRRWHMLVIAILSVLSAIFSIIGPVPTLPSFPLLIGLLLNSIRAAMGNPGFALTLSRELLLLCSGAALVFVKPWSRFGYLVVAILFTGQALFSSYRLMTIPTPSTGIAPYIPSLLIGLVVAVVIYWGITALIFRYFQSTKDLTVRSRADAP